MTVVVYRWYYGEYKELFRITGNKVSNEYGEMFLRELGIPMNEDAVFKSLKSNGVYLVERVGDESD